MLLDLRYYGDPILRQKALPVKEITDEIRAFTNSMIETMLHYKGIGLAAPQVGKLLRIFISNVESEDEEGEVHYGKPTVYINPILTNPSEAMDECSEGCLSIPGFYAHTLRPLSIDLEAMDLEGNIFHEKCYGYQARNRMHENDHLNGVLFIDRIKGARRNQIDDTLRRIKLQYYYRLNKQIT